MVFIKTATPATELTGTIDGDRLPTLSTSKRGGVKETGSPAGKYLKDSDTWDFPTPRASGSSTGTGSEQTIAHGLTPIPTGCTAWIKFPISATRFMKKEIDFDTTNVYPTLNTGIAYEWRIE